MKIETLPFQTRRTLAIAMVTLAMLVAPVASTAPLSADTGTSSTTGWSFLPSFLEGWFFSADRSETAAAPDGEGSTGEAGPSMDPNGLPVASGPDSTTGGEADAGPSMDPNG